MEPETDARLSKLETDLEKLRKKPKDSWDKLAAVAPFVSGAMIGVIGIYATSTYNARQLETQALQKDREIAVARVQTVEKFFPHLSSTDENVREAALDAIAVMGEEQLALRFAAHFGGRSGAAVLARLANSPDPKVSVPASSALADQFERLRSVVANVRSTSGSQSTGFFVSSDGLLVVPSFILESKTNADAHITVQLHGVQESFVAQLLARDDEAHLALLRVRLGRPVTPVQTWNTEPKLGDQALVLAFIGGSEWVSRSGSIVGLDVQNLKDTRGRIATDIPSSPGFAGAPVVDTSGRLIGMAESRDAAGKSVVIQAATIRTFLVRQNAG